MYPPIRIVGPYVWDISGREWDVSVMRREARHRPTGTRYRIVSSQPGSIELRQLEAHLICGDVALLTPELHRSLAQDAIILFECAAHDVRANRPFLNLLGQIGRHDNQSGGDGKIDTDRPALMLAPSAVSDQPTATP